MLEAKANNFWRAENETDCWRAYAVGKRDRGSPHRVTPTLAGLSFNKLMRALSERYSKRLGVDPAELLALHVRMVAAAPSLRARWLAERQQQGDDEEGEAVEC